MSQICLLGPLLLQVFKAKLDLFILTQTLDALDQEALTSSPKFNIDVNNKHHDDEGYFTIYKLPYSY